MLFDHVAINLQPTWFFCKTKFLTNSIKRPFRIVMIISRRLLSGWPSNALHELQVSLFCYVFVSQVNLFRIDQMNALPDKQVYHMDVTFGLLKGGWLGHKYPDANMFGAVRFVWVPRAFCGVHLHNGSEYLDLCPLHCCQLNLEI